MSRQVATYNVWGLRIEYKIAFLMECSQNSKWVKDPHKNMNRLPIVVFFYPMFL